MTTVYSVTVTNTPLASQLDKVPLIQQTIQAAGMWLSSFIKGQGVLDIQVEFDPNIATWSGRPLANRFSGSTITKNGNTYRVLDQSTWVEINTGVDITGSGYDGIINIGTTNLDKFYFFDSTLQTPADIPKDKRDAFLSSLHELLHNLGFNGWFAQGNSGTSASRYETFLTEDSGRTFFMGPNAIAAFGGPVPVTDSHLGDAVSVANGTLKSSNTLMGHDAAAVGVRLPLDPVIFSVLRDVGYTVRDTQAKLQGTAGKIDIVNAPDPTATYQIMQTSDLKWLATTNTSDYAYLLDSVERLNISGKYLAIDLDGNAGIVVKLLGAVFGAQSVTNKTYVGIGLDLLDKGTSKEALATLALKAAQATTNTKVVELLWHNVIGTAPTQAQLDPYLKMLDTGTSPATLALMAADTTYNTAHIDLVGLSKSGVEYLPV